MAWTVFYPRQAIPGISVQRALDFITLYLVSVPRAFEAINLVALLLPSELSKMNSTEMSFLQ